MDSNDISQGTGQSRPPNSSETESSKSSPQSSVKEQLSDASAAIKNEAGEIGSQAQRIAGEQAEKVKEAATSHLDVFADALRAASDELGKSQSGPAAEMVSNAAAGLEGLTRSLHGQSTGQIIDTVRKFGRENPIGFLAGSVLAGLALGRFAAVASTDHSNSGQTEADRVAASSPSHGHDGSRNTGGFQ